MTPATFQLSHGDPFGVSTEVWREMTEGTRQQLEVLHISEKERILQPPGWYTGLAFGAGQDLWSRLNVPHNHFTFISTIAPVVPRIDCSQVQIGGSLGLHIWTGEGDGERKVLVKKNSRVSSPFRVDGGVIRVRVCCGLRSLSGCDVAGPQLRLTFHQASSDFPRLISKTLWNCSTGDWAAYRPHFACNLTPECVGARDELDCVHSGCGPGKISVAGSCFWTTYLKIGNWIKGNKVCHEGGGRLAILDSPEEWRVVTELLPRVSRLDHRNVALALTTGATDVPDSYGRTALWSNNAVAYIPYDVDVSFYRYQCGNLPSPHFTKAKVSGACQRITVSQYILCEIENTPVSRQVQTVNLTHPRRANFSVPCVTCRESHVTLSFLPCDAAMVEDDVTVEKGMGTLGGSLFGCDDGLQRVPFTLVCDHRHDCADHSDEGFCRFPACPRGSIQCGARSQCIPLEQWCDWKSDCQGREDTLTCAHPRPMTWPTERQTVVPPPAIVLHRPNSSTGLGLYMLPLSPGPGGEYQCPETHFRCPGEVLCQPVFVRCNGIKDCPSHEDEADCGDYSCPGLYRCRGSRVCLHAEHVCDRLYHCPLQDDELYCHLHCPPGCTCYGLALWCPVLFDSVHVQNLRYLDGSDSGMRPRHLADQGMLVHLILRRCALTVLGNVTFPNLRHLDLGDNLLPVVQLSHIKALPNLRYLVLAGNPLAPHIIDNDDVRATVSHVLYLDISRVKMKTFSTASLSLTPNLKSLNLSQNGIEQLEGSFEILKQLSVLDIRGCALETFQRDVVKDLSHFQRMYADNYKMCCPSTLPADFNVHNCRAPFDEVSSCQSLLRSDAYRVALALFAVFALTGNVGSFLIRMFVLERKGRSGFSVFVSHLCVSDFLMGVYLAIIGLADHEYRGTYLWEDVRWRHSAACQAAGFLCLLSSEVSAVLVCCITLDRFLALTFPLSAVRFTLKTSHLACCLTWILGLTIALVPLLPATAHWQFYPHTGICMPLPVTREDFAGRDYSFSIVIVLNFVLFLLIALGQVCIYLSIRANSMAVEGDSSRKTQDVTIARRLFTIAVSDFLCWFPVGLLGLLSSRGVAVPGEVRVGMAVLVLPLNAALNPGLYSLNLLLERRRRAAQHTLLATLEGHLREQEQNTLRDSS